MATDLFDADDFKSLAQYVNDAWTAGLDRDWSAPAGTLEWSCLYTADHTIDCVFSYALFLASERQDAYPRFGELHALDDAGPADMVEGLRAVSRMLWATIVTADPDERAIITQSPPSTGSPADFAARGAHEMVLHAFDVCSGLGVPFDPPRDLCDRLWRHTSTWSKFGALAASSSGDSWHDLLARSGRAPIA